MNNPKEPQIDDNNTRQDKERPKFKKYRKIPLTTILSAVSILLVLTLIVFFVLFSAKFSKQNRALRNGIERLYEEVETIRENVTTLSSENGQEKHIIDLTSTGYQKIGDGFYTEGLSMESHLTGVRISGRIVNYHMVTYSNIRFRLTIASSNNVFFVDRILPGSSRYFEVYIPDIDIRGTNYGYIQCIDRWMGHY